MTQDIIVRGEQGRTKLAPFGSSAEVKEFGKRVLATITVKLKGGATRPLSPKEAGMMAAACLAHGLDPYAGDIYPMEDKDGNFSLAIGRNAWVKAANQAMKNNGGGNFWFDDRFITDNDERIALRIPAGAIAVETKLCDTISIREYSQACERLAKTGASWAEIQEVLGKRPSVVAIGIYEPNENTKYQDKNFTPVERAKKRAHTAAIKAKWNLPFDEYGEGANELPSSYKSNLPDGVTVIEQEGKA